MCATRLRPENLDVVKSSGRNLGWLNILIAVDHAALRLTKSLKDRVAQHQQSRGVERIWTGSVELKQLTASSDSLMFE